MRIKDISSFFDRYDIFAHATPNFNIDGKEKIGTCVGFCFTLLLTALMVSYGSVCSYFFFAGTRPNISSYPIRNGRSVSEKINLKTYNFQLAFAAEKIINNVDESALEDDNYAEWAVFVETKNGTNVVNQVWPYHKCMAEDYDKFNPIVEEKKQLLEKKRDQFYCLDGTDKFGNELDLKIYGKYDSHMSRTISIVYRPCIPRQQGPQNSTEKCLI